MGVAMLDGSRCRCSPQLRELVSESGVRLWSTHEGEVPLKTVSRNVLLIAFLVTPLVCRVEAAPPDPAAPVDQVVVAASRERLAKLEKEVQEAEQRFYSRYNALNTKRDYAVKCYNEAETGSRFKKNYCQPVFTSKAQEEQARRTVASLTSSSTPQSTSSAASAMHGGAMGGVGGGTGSAEPSESLPGAFSSVTGVPAIMAVEGSQSDYQKNMMELTRKHPELMELLNKHAELVKEYEATLRQVSGREPQDAGKAAVPATSPQ